MAELHHVFVQATQSMRPCDRPTYVFVIVSVKHRGQSVRANDPAIVGECTVTSSQEGQISCETAYCCAVVPEPAPPVTWVGGSAPVRSTQPLPAHNGGNPFCGGCGKAVDGNTAFCAGCGKPTGSTAAAGEQAPPAYASLGPHTLSEDKRRH